MKYAESFKRYELKYILTPGQKDLLMKAMEGKMELDGYGRTTIRNIYYDTPDMRLIRNSLDRPAYKEKLRLRSYSRVGEDDPVFVEIKKKYDGIVWKRRIAVPEHQATDWLTGTAGKPFDSQIANEIEYMRTFYKDLRPSCFLTYEREAFYEKNGGDLRITTDENITARDRNMSLRYGTGGTKVLDGDLTLLEVKTPGSLPMWLVRFLSENNIRKTSFSKYGEYYAGTLFPKMKEETKGGLLYA
ncbi:MAG: polyphosphate polymerase domain-containing protein [Clostridiales bacterium]|nr:polyphosphate polymerase domain-containing protein [Clostridiales bacterium]MBR6483826.1 polyphosphate polymerase domain-containing protein [Clostridiales bacterium]